MNLVIDISAADKSRAAVVSIANPTPVTQLEQLQLGDSAPLTVTFTDSSVSPPAAPAWAGNAGYTLTAALGSLDINGLLNLTSTSTFTPITAGWTGRLSLATQALIDAMAYQVGFSVNRSRYPIGYFNEGQTLAAARNGWFQLQLSVTASGNRVTYANLRVPVLNRVLAA